MKPRIAVASGKGGTGKTTFAVNLAASMGKNITYVDADVEEPNGHIFLKPSILEKISVKVLVPQVDEAKCTGCGECKSVCQFNALILLKEKVLFFPELCHSCGACLLVCPHSALFEVNRKVGMVRKGKNRDISFIEGRLTEGEAKSSPVIKALNQYLPQNQVCIIDVQPGSSCPVIEGVNLADFVVLVTEPTPFGFHDLMVAIELMDKLNLPYGVVINRSDLGDNQIERYCQDKGIPVLMRIPFSKEFALLSSQGKLLVEEIPALKPQFLACYDFIKDRLDSIKEKSKI